MVARLPRRRPKGTKIGNRTSPEAREERPPSWLPPFRSMRKVPLCEGKLVCAQSPVAPSCWLVCTTGRDDGGGDTGGGGRAAFHPAARGRGSLWPLIGRRKGVSSSFAHGGRKPPKNSSVHLRHRYEKYEVLRKHSGDTKRRTSEEATSLAWQAPKNLDPRVRFSSPPHPCSQTFWWRNFCLP